MKVLEPAGLNRLLEALVECGYRLLGPTVADGAIVYDEIRSWLRGLALAGSFE